MENKKRKILKISAVAAALIAAAIFGIFLRLNYPERGVMSAVFIDVGQGDSCFVAAGDKNILIDGGPSADAEEVTAVLDRYRVKRLDLVIASHPDSDHVSGLPKIIDNYEVGSFLTSGTAGELPSPLSEALKRRNISLSYASAGESFNVGNALLEVLSPGREYDNTNDSSLVVRLSSGGGSILFTGDISSEVEKDILKSFDPKSDVLKVAHHGSYSATSAKFLKRVDPSFAVVSVSRYNSHNLPNVETMRRLYGFGCEVLRTDENGTVTLRYDGTKFSYSAEK